MDTYTRDDKRLIVKIINSDLRAGRTAYAIIDDSRVRIIRARVKDNILSGLVLNSGKWVELDIFETVD